MSELLTYKHLSSTLDRHHLAVATWHQGESTTNKKSEGFPHIFRRTSLGNLDTARKRDKPDASSVSSLVGKEEGWVDN